MTNVTNYTIGNQSPDTVPTDTVSLFDNNQIDRVYNICNIDIHYITDYHTVQLPIANNDSDICQFAVLSQPTMRKIVKFTIEVGGDFGQLPAPYSGDPNEILLYSNIVPANVDTDGTGKTVVTRVSGEYRYGIIDPTKVKLVAAATPYLTKTIQENEITSTYFDASITSSYTQPTRDPLVYQTPLSLSSLKP